MALIDLFDSGDKKKRLSHIKNLVALAASDGQMDELELDLIFRIGLQVGLTKEELLRILERPTSISFNAPDSFRERIEQLYDMVLIMMVDGEIHDNEVAFCKITAIRLGFRHEVIDKMVAEVIENIAEGMALQLILSDLEKQYA